jgi:hypothetical protein
MQRAKVLLSAAMLWATWTSFAAAQATDASPTSRGSIGLGAAATLTMPVGIQFVYDPGAWHMDVITSLRHDGGTDIAASARFFYHVHTAQAADFSLGGGVGFQNSEGNDNIVHVELSAQIRAFIVSNVALSGTLGLGLRTADRNDFVVSGQTTGILAVTYFF